MTSPMKGWLTLNSLTWLPFRERRDQVVSKANNLWLLDVLPQETNYLILKLLLQYIKISGLKWKHVTTITSHSLTKALMARLRKSF